MRNVGVICFEFDDTLHYLLVKTVVISNRYNLRVFEKSNPKMMNRANCLMIYDYTPKNIVYIHYTVRDNEVCMTYPRTILTDTDKSLVMGHK